MCFQNIESLGIVPWIFEEIGKGLKGRVERKRVDKERERGGGEEEEGKEREEKEEKEVGEEKNWNLWSEKKRWI